MKQKCEKPDFTMGKYCFFMEKAVFVNRWHVAETRFLTVTRLKPSPYFAHPAH